MKRDDLTTPESIRLMPEHRARADALASRVGCPRSTVLRWAITLGIEALERPMAPGMVESILSRAPTMRGVGSD